MFPVVNYAQVKAHCQSLVDGEVRCGLWPASMLRSSEVCGSYASRQCAWSFLGYELKFLERGTPFYALLGSM